MILILQDIGHWYRLLQHRFQLHLSVCVCLFRLHIFSARCIFTTPKIVFEYQVQWFKVEVKQIKILYFMFKGHQKLQVKATGLQGHIEVKLQIR